jgi:hypothetical protein
MLASRNIDPLVVWITARMNDENSLSLLEARCREDKSDSVSSTPARQNLGYTAPEQLHGRINYRCGMEPRILLKSQVADGAAAAGAR